MLAIRITALLATIVTTQAVDYFKASCTSVPAGTVFVDEHFSQSGKLSVVGPANTCLTQASTIIKCTGCGSTVSTCIPASTNSACSSVSAPANQAACDPQTVAATAGLIY